MCKRILLLLILFSLSFSTSLNLSGALKDTGSADLNAVLQFDEPGERNFCLALSAPVDEVTVTDKSGLALEHSIQGNSICAVVPYDFLRFNIVSDSFTSKNASLWLFDLSIGASENISFLEAELELPRGTTLKSTNGAVQASEESLSISWNAKNIDPSHKAHLRAGYEVVPVEEINNLWLVAFLIVFATLFPLMHWLLRKEQKEHKPESKEDALETNKVFKTLDEVEKEIVREIYKNKGKTTQSHLYLHTHIPKATLSRRIASLENRGLLIKSRRGNRNLVSLGEMLKKS